MKFSCSQSELSQHIAHVIRAIPSRPSQPVLANLLIEAEGDSLTLSAFDLSISIRTKFSATIEEPGRTTLPAKLLSEIVSKLPNEPITVSVSTEEDSIKAELVQGTGRQRKRYEIRGMAADDYPELPTVESEAITLPVDLLMQGLDATLFATSTDETKQVLTGVHLKAEGAEFECASTDGHRLSVAEIALEDSVEKVEVTIPAKALRELERIATAASVAELSMALDPYQAVFEVGDQRITTRLLEGQYPNYRQLLPKSFVREATVDRKLLISSLERIAVLADQRNNVVKFSIAKDGLLPELTLSVEAQDVGSGSETLTLAAYEGDPITLAFNVKYIVEGLKGFDSTEVMLSLNTETSPVVVRPVGDAKQVYLVMPVQIRS